MADSPTVDRQGFGRRRLEMTPASFENCLVMQVGGLKALASRQGVGLNHFKAHGQAYMMSSKDGRLADAAVRAARTFSLPFVGLAGTQHERACREMGVEFIAGDYRSWVVMSLIGLTRRRMVCGLRLCQSTALTSG